MCDLSIDSQLPEKIAQDVSLWMARMMTGIILPISPTAQSSLSLAAADWLLITCLAAS